MHSKKISFISIIKRSLIFLSKKQGLLFIFFLFLIPNLFGQTYEIDDIDGNTISTCSGTFTDDNNGFFGNYSNNQNYATTICSDNGNSIEFDFTSWNVQNNGSCNFDGLRIYDGTDNTATNLGTFCTNSPGVITSSGTCLHFEFYSNVFFTESGWEASISCIKDADGDGIFDYIDQDDDNDGILDCIEKRLSNATFDEIFTINGDANQISSTELQVTENLNAQVGSAFSKDRIDFNQDFSFSFEVNLGSSNSGADGLAIVFHNDPAGSAAIGGAGSGLGANGIQDGIVLEIDTHNNSTSGIGDTGNDHTMIWDSDNQTGAGLLTTAIGFGNIEDGGWRTVTITWNATTQNISYTLDGANAGSFTNDLVNNYFDGENLIHFGFTGSTGGSTNDQRIRFASGFCGFQLFVDDDNDGVENHLDLDSDNDGIYDAYEAGHGEIPTAGRLTGAVGANGYVDVLETSVDNNIPTYTLANTDGGTFADFTQLDADNDGCFDAFEANIDDSDDDGIAGTGAPAVGLHGLVNSITYTAPPNNFWQNTIVSACADTDGDGIINAIDLDDDNDGIPDYDELFCSLGSSTSATFSSLTQAWQSTGSTMDAGKIYTLIPSGSSLGNANVSGGPNDGQNVEVIQFAGDRFSDLDGYGYFYTGNILESLLRAPSAIGFANLTGTEYDYLLTFIGMIDVNGNGQYDVGVDQVIPRLFLENNSIRFTANVTGDFYVVYTDSNYGDNSGSFSFTVNECVPFDTDGDGVFDYLDLDSDNDGIWDAIEAGHYEFVTDGRMTGNVGANGLADVLEDVVDDGLINYSIADSDSDGLYDFQELDSDNDTCNDTDELRISDPDVDGIADTGVPTVDANGVITTITYSTPFNNFWQNTSINVCEDNDGDGVKNTVDLDDDNDGILDLDEQSCGVLPPGGIGIPTEVTGGTPVTSIYTNFGDFWESSTGAISTILPTTSHELLAFTTGGATYSTGVPDDDVFDADTNGFYESVDTDNNGSGDLAVNETRWQAFSNINEINNRLSLEGSLNDGDLTNALGLTVANPPSEPLNPLLTNGVQGLDLGTGVANVGESWYYKVEIISAFAVGDGVPDLLLTQVASPSSSTYQIITFYDASWSPIGNSVRVESTGSGGLAPQIGNYRLDIYNGTGGVWGSANTTRPMRLATLELGEFGIAPTEVANVFSMKIEFSNTADVAFVAYNTGSFSGLCAELDTDNDGIPNRFDNDSDNDGCADAIEGADNFTLNNLTPGSELNGLIDINGVPQIASGGQATTDDVIDNTINSQCNCSTIRTNRHISSKVTN